MPVIDPGFYRGKYHSDVVVEVTGVDTTTGLVIMDIPVGEGQGKIKSQVMAWELFERLFELASNT
jgi:hypothetical protein